MHLATKSKKGKLSHLYVTSTPVTAFLALWSTVLLTFTSLTEQRNASGYKRSQQGHVKNWADVMKKEQIYIQHCSKASKHDNYKAKNNPKKIDSFIKIKWPTDELVLPDIKAVPQTLPDQSVRQIIKKKKKYS